MPHRLVCVAALLWALTGCEDEQRSTAAKRDDVVAVQSGDAEVDAAVAKARQALPQFIAALQSPRPNQTEFVVKARFEEADAVEYMWVGDLTYDGARFHGTLDNDPAAITSLKHGDKVSIEPAKVVDWMYAEDGKAVGGYTSAVLKARMKR